MDDNTERKLAENDDLWGQLLGRKLDRIPVEERSVNTLVDKFSDNKKELVRFHHQSVEALKKEIHDSDYQEAKETLFFLWAEYEWRNKSTGTKFELKDDLDTELDRLENEGNIIRRLNERFALVWSPEEHRRYLKKSDSIQSEVQTEAKPVFIRSIQEEDIVEVRGPSRLLDNFTEEFTNSQDVKEKEPEPTDEPVLDKLSTVFESELAALTLIEARFNSTNLPSGSTLSLSNRDGIKEDLNESTLRDEYINTDNLSDLDYLKFIHEKTEVQVKVSVEREDEGFHFLIDDSNLPEDEKKNIRELIEDKIGIAFDKLYPYDTQHHEEYIINQILTCNVDVYRKYYDLLDNEAQDFIDKFVDASGQDTLYCYNCHEGYLHFQDEPMDSCPDCGTTLMKGAPSLSLDIKENKIVEEVARKLKEFGSDIKGADGTRLLQLSFESTEIANNTYIKSDFHLAEAAGTAMDSHWYEFFIYCLGNGNIPSRVSNYLLDCVLVTYGSSEVRGRENFGTISLYTLLQGENPEEEFVKAVRQSQSNLRNRVREQGKEAEERLQDLQQKVNDGTIKNATMDDRAELKSEYDFQDFERDVFYLFKSMFLFTERWGREGKKETDGCLILPDGQNGYFVASYDPKLTYDIEGYDLGSDEKNKAAYYILSETNHEYISNVLKDGGTIDSHIFISDIFRKGQFKYVAETVNDWFSLTESGADSIDVPLIFLSLESLLDLYRLFDSNYNFIIEYPKVQKAFRYEIQNQLNTDNQYHVINKSSVERVEEKVLEARSIARKKKAAKGYTDS